MSSPELGLLLEAGPADGPTLALAHGAGGPMDAPFMEQLAEGLAAAGVRSVRFEFPYMQERRRSGKRRPPNSASKLEAHWETVIDHLGGGDAVFVGGKSMGGRIAARVADRVGVRGLVAFGFPFHPPGRPEKTRLEHISRLVVPGLILQGERDPFGRREEVAGYALPTSVEVVWLPDGDHSLKPRKASGHTLESNLSLAIEAAAAFVLGRD